MYNTFMAVLLNFTHWFASLNTADKVVLVSLFVGISLLFCLRILLRFVNDSIRFLDKLIHATLTHTLDFSEIPDISKLQVIFYKYQYKKNRKTLGKVRQRVDIAYVIEIVMQIIITIALLSISFYVILSKNTFDDGTKKWAFGAIGSVVGYWFPKRK